MQMKGFCVLIKNNKSPLAVRQHRIVINDELISDNRRKIALIPAALLGLQR